MPIDTIAMPLRYMQPSEGGITRLETVVRALRLLRLLAKKPLCVQEVAEQLEVHKSTASRLLSSLRKERFVRLNAERKYELGYAVFELANALCENMDILKMARPYLEEMHRKTNETVHLAVIDGTDVIYLDKIDTARAIRMYSRVGKRAHAYCTGVGKVLLAYLPPSKLNKILSQISFKPLTKNTIVDVNQMTSELQEIRSHGLAWDHGEHEEGIYCIAAPVLGFNDQVIAAISISITTNYTSVDLLASYSDLLTETAKGISKLMGYVGDWPPHYRS